MSSVNFNASATQALRALQASSTALESMQRRISTGIAIGDAKDNAAYWSIATTMRSDNKALAAVTDSLGLGAASVDTAYQGLSSARIILDEIRSKLTLAVGSGVDRTAIQAEIASLQKQLQGIASSSIFAGENWLSINSAMPGYSAQKSVLSSFTRDAAGNVTVGEIKIDTRDTALFDTNASASTKGILDTAVNLSVSVGGVETSLSFGGRDAGGNRSTGGLEVGSGPNGTGASPAYASHTLVADNAFDGTKLALGDTIQFKIFSGSDVVGKDVSLVIDDATRANEAYFRAFLAVEIGRALQSSYISVVDGGPDGDVVIRSTLQGSDQTFRIGAVSVTNDAPSSILGLSPTPLSGTAAVNGIQTILDLGEFDPAGGKIGDELSFGIEIDGVSHLIAVTLDASNIADAAILKNNIVTAVNGAAAFNASRIEAIDYTADMAFRLVTPADTSAGTDVTFALTTGVTVVHQTTDLAAAGIVSSAGSQTTGAGTRSVIIFDTFEPMVFDADDRLSLTVNGTSVVVDKALVSLSLGTTNGRISSAAEFSMILSGACQAANIPVYFGVDETGRMGASTTVAGFGAKVSITAVSANLGALATGSSAAISVRDIDVSDDSLALLNANTDQKKEQAIAAYIHVVNSAIGKITAAASAMGVAASRIEMQRNFVQTLMDTLERRVSNLVDADMNEASIRLQALRVKSELGMQALSIANRSAQNVIRLFQ